MGSNETSTNGDTVDNPVKIDPSTPEKADIAQAHSGHSPTLTKSELPMEPQEGTSLAKAAVEKSHEDLQAAEKSPGSKKRSASETSEEPVTKKSKSEDEEVPPRSPTMLNRLITTAEKEQWQGYCEIESDPAYLSVILRDIGVEGIDVKELAFLDTEYLCKLPPVYGIVLLFRHRSVDNDKQVDECPEGVWFANQMPGQNSCATLAMTHTILNIDDPDIDIGEYMRQFKDFTQEMKPVHRGMAFASWKRLKGIHNSFAKKMDILENDKYIAAKAKQAEKLKAAGGKKPAAAKTKPRSKTARRDSGDSINSDDSIEAFEANAHHYIAFVPIDGEVWKLDGMEKQPTLMSTYDEDQGESWYEAISDRVNAVIGAGDSDYVMFALTQSPIIGLRNKLCQADNTIKHVDARLTALNTDWKEFIDEDDREPPSPSFMGSFTGDMRAANPVPDSTKAKIDQEDDLTVLLGNHTKIVSWMRHLVNEYMEAMQEIDEQEQKAKDRRWDYGPAIQLWLSILAKNGYLQEHMDEFAEM